MVNFLKRYGLPFGLKKAAKKVKQRGQSPGYLEARTILLLFTSAGNQKIALVKSFQNRLEKDGKKVKCLYLLLKDEDKPDVHMDEGMVKLEPLDFKLFGQITNPEVNELLNEDFDYMIHLDVESTIYTDLVMSKSNAKCRIGKYFDNHKQQYDMMVGIKEDKKENYLIDQIYHYTKAL